MLKELFHYITMPMRDKNRIKKCVQILKDNSANSNEVIEKISSLNDSEDESIIQFVDILIIAGNEVSFSEDSHQEYWTSLKGIASDHKCRDQVIQIMKCSGLD